MKIPASILSSVALACATALFLHDLPVPGSIFALFSGLVWLSDVGSNAAPKKPTPPQYAQ